MAAVKYEFSIGALKAFYSIFCRDILLVYISKNAVSENKKKSPPKFQRSAPLRDARSLWRDAFFVSLCPMSQFSTFADGFAVSANFPQLMKGLAQEVLN